MNLLEVIGCLAVVIWILVMIAGAVTWKNDALDPRYGPGAQKKVSE